MKKLIVAGIALLSFTGAGFGAPAQASGYPPSPKPNEPIVNSDAPAAVNSDAPAAVAGDTLPRTGSDPSVPLLAGAAVIAAGSGLVVSARRRTLKA